MHFIQFLWMHMFKGLVARIVNSMVASSSPVGGSGTLHCGIRAHVAAWAWMGHERSARKGRLPSAQQRSKIYDKKLPQNSPKCENYRLIKKFSGNLFRCSGELGGIPPDRGHSEENLRKFFLSVRQPSAENSGCGSRSFGGDQPRTTKIPVQFSWWSNCSVGGK